MRSQYASKDAKIVYLKNANKAIRKLKSHTTISRP